MDKETMVQIHNGIVPSLKKEGIWASSNEVDASRAYYTELDKSEKEKQISYINVHVWNLERWFWRMYLQGSDFPGSSDGKASAYNVGDLGSIPGEVSRRSPGEGNGNPLQYSCLENPMDWGAW